MVCSSDSFHFLLIFVGVHRMHSSSAVAAFFSFGQSDFGHARRPDTIEFVAILLLFQSCLLVLHFVDIYWFLAGLNVQLELSFMLVSLIYASFSHLCTEMFLFFAFLLFFFLSARFDFFHGLPLVGRSVLSALSNVVCFSLRIHFGCGILDDCPCDFCAY